jgi:hypothetical protein
MLVEADSQPALIDNVEALLPKLQPLGSPVIVLDSAGCDLYAQAMVESEEQHEELQRLRGIEARAKMMRAELDSQRGISSDADLGEYTKEHLRLVLGVEGA